MLRRYVAAVDVLVTVTLVVAAPVDAPTYQVEVSLKVALVSAVFLNAVYPMLITPLPMVTLVKLVQSLNA